MLWGHLGNNFNKRSGTTNRFSRFVYRFNRRLGASVDRASYTPYKGYKSSDRTIYPPRTQ